ncbi:MAG: VPLPA-CTERM-specific exosortase XrtD [Thermodesulfobacteriota bacterium]
MAATDSPASETQHRCPTWILLGLALLAGLLYGDILRKWGIDLWTDSNYSHGLLIPFVSLYFLYQRRQELRQTSMRPWLPGLLPVVAALLLLLAGRIGAELFSQRLSLILLLYGSLLLLCGRALVRVVSFPVGILLFAVPLPYVLYNAVAFPLKLLATRIAANLLQLTGTPVFFEGNIIHLSHTTLEVVDACSGIRSLMTLVTLAFFLAHLFLARWWQKLLIVLLAVPVTVLTNSLRVTANGILSRYSDAFLHGFWHDATGWLVFVLSFAVLAGLAHLLGKVAAPRSPAAAAGAQADQSGASRGAKSGRPLPCAAAASLIAVLLLGTFLAAGQAQSVRPTPLPGSLTDFPEAIGSFRKTGEITFDQSVVDLAGMDSYLMWYYTDPDGYTVGLYLGYYLDQSEGNLIHSPKHCMPGSGWLPVDDRRERIDTGDGAVTVNAYTLQKGLDRQLAYFWYQGRGRVVAGEFHDRALMIYDSLVRRRSDGALVRVTGPASDLETARTKQQAFVRELLPVLDRFLPK